LHFLKSNSKPCTVVSLITVEHYSTALVLYYVSCQHTQRGKSTGGRRRDDHGNPQGTRQIDRVQSTSSSKRQQRELAGVVAALDRDMSQRAFHVCICHRQDTLRGRIDAAASAGSSAYVVSQPSQGLASAIFVEREFAS
jgi:hypothetical protein